MIVRYGEFPHGFLDLRPIGQAVSKISRCGASRLSCLLLIQNFFFSSRAFEHLEAVSTTLFPRIAMVDKHSGREDGSRAKRQKTDKADMDPRANPYLAHMYPEENGSQSSQNGPFASFTRHQTTAALAAKAEDGDVNPFNDRPFSSKYMSILKTRRNLPVHAQR